jgi:hypothetical protein
MSAPASKETVVDPVPVPPQTLATPPPPQVCGAVQVPQATVPPHPSLRTPQFLLALVQLFGTQVEPHTLGVPPPPQVAGTVQVLAVQSSVPPHALGTVPQRPVQLVTVSVQPHTLAVPPPPQVLGDVQVLALQLSVPLEQMYGTMPQKPVQLVTVSVQQVPAAALVQIAGGVQYLLPQGTLHTLPWQTSTPVQAGLQAACASRAPTRPSRVATTTAAPVRSIKLSPGCARPLCNACARRLDAGSRHFDARQSATVAERRNLFRQSMRRTSPVDGNTSGVHLVLLTVLVRLS